MKRRKRVFAAILVCLLAMQPAALAEYHSRLMEQIGEDIPYSEAIAALIEKPNAVFADGDFSVTMDEIIDDGCNLYVLYTVSSAREEPVLFASDYLHFAGLNEWVVGDYSIAAGFGHVLRLDEQHGKSRQLMATMQLDPAEQGLDKTLAFTGWFFEPLSEIEWNEAGYSVSSFKKGDADSVPATMEGTGLARTIAQVEVALPIQASPRSFAYVPAPVRVDFEPYSVTVTRCSITPLSARIELRIDAQTAQELQAATRKKSYAVRDAQGNAVLDMNWYSEEAEDESGADYVQFVGDAYGQTVIPSRIQLVPFSVEALDAILDQSPDVSWEEAEKQASRWEEAVWMEIVQ